MACPIKKPYSEGIWARFPKDFQTATFGDRKEKGKRGPSPRLWFDVWFGLAPNSWLESGWDVGIYSRFIAIEVGVMIYAIMIFIYIYIYILWKLIRRR